MAKEYLAASLDDDQEFGLEIQKYLEHLYETSNAR